VASASPEAKANRRKQQPRVSVPPVAGDSPNVDGRREFRTSDFRPPAMVWQVLANHKDIAVRICEVRLGLIQCSVGDLATRFRQRDCPGLSVFATEKEAL
jgi:hypothetical protein